MIELSFLPEHFINRELSWLEFNARVLEEAGDSTTPLLERVKFLSIFSSNLDEFFMVRVAGLREQAFGGGDSQDFNADGLKPINQLERIAQRTQELVAEQYRCLNDEVLPKLAQHGIEIVPIAQVGDKLNDFFRNTIFPTITPMAVDPSHPPPHFHNRGLYLAAMLTRHSGLGPKQLFAVVQLPQILPRLIPIATDSPTKFVLLEDLVASRLSELFGGYLVESSTNFRITRDSDLDVIEQESDDMLRLIEDRLKARQRLDAVRLEVAANADDAIVRKLVEQEELRESLPGGTPYTEVYRIPGPLDLTSLTPLLKLPGFEQLRDKPFIPQQPRGLRRRGEDIFAAIARHDVLLHHPYDSFAPVVEFITRAAEDPKVLAIKQTLYRTSGDSPVVRALMKAAENGKHVTAMVELQARFDEANNVSWARQMERSGVHTVFGFMDLKTHSKLSLVVRQEGDAVRRYVHMSTGNYNPSTATTYTDLGLFTADPEIAADASALFNLLTGYSQGHDWKKLVIAPEYLQRRTVELIEEQTRRAQAGQPAKVFAKLNSLVDVGVMESLYRASQAGVKIDLVVRGICCLRPGIPGISDNIRVRSIVDRFLEHSRVMVFGPEDDCKVFLSSADWMPRNFYRRVEVMSPVESPILKSRILHEIIPAYMRDNTRSRLLRADGRYERPQLAEGEPRYRAQEELMQIHMDKTMAHAALLNNSNGEAGVSSNEPVRVVQ